MKMTHRIFGCESGPSGRLSQTPLRPVVVFDGPISLCLPTSVSRDMSTSILSFSTFYPIQTTRFGRTKCDRRFYAQVLPCSFLASATEVPMTIGFGMDHNLTRFFYHRHYESRFLLSHIVTFSWYATTCRPSFSSAKVLFGFLSLPSLFWGVHRKESI